MRIFELVQKEEKNKFPWKSYNLSSTVTASSTTRGATSATVYGLQPMGFVKKAIDAARERMRFLEVAHQEVMPVGFESWAVPKRKKYLADSSWESSSSEYSAGNEISWTEIDTMDSVIFTPTRYNFGVALTNDAIRKNLLNLVNYCNEELSYKYENSIDTAIRDAICGTVKTDSEVSGGDNPSEPTPMSNTVNGAQTIFGGDATDAADSLDSGDVLTPELIKKAKRLLMSTSGYYWNSNVHTKSAVTKNPWTPTDGEPFVLFLAPEQMESLMNDSQFTNAAEFGSQEPVLKGWVARYCGIDFIETTKVPDFGDGEQIRVQGSNVSVDVDGHICALVKAQRAVGIVWGQKAEFRTFDWPNADQVRMKLSMSYAAGVIHPDAIVRIVVSDS
ncbi:MAG: hypothetical protein ACTSXO_04665 [Candidatus Heimdallarchaeota archaeon]